MRSYLPLKYALAYLLSLSLVGAFGCSSDSGGGLGISSDEMSIVNTVPEGGAVDVEPQSTISAKFSTAVRFDSVTVSSFQVDSSLHGPVTGVYHLAENDRTVVFTPSEDLSSGDTITVTITDDVRGNGDVKSESASFTFVVVGDLPPVNPPEPPPTPGSPGITHRSPGPGEVASLLDTTVVIEFAESMDSSTFSSNTVLLRGELTGLVPTALAISSLADGGTRLSIVPDNEYLPGERVSVVLSADLSTNSGESFEGESYEFLAPSLAADPRGDALSAGPDVAVEGTVVQLETADLDGDGLLDVVARTEAGTTLQVFTGIEDGLFGDPLTLDLQQIALTIHVSDEDGDGWLDILVGAVDRVQIFHNLGGETLTFDDPEYLPVGVAVHDIAAADIDHLDVTRPDFVLDTDSGLQVYLGGLEGSPDQTLGDTRMPRTSVSVVNVYFPTKDLPFDTWPEIVYGDSVGNRISIHPFVPAESRFLEEPVTLALPSDAMEVHAVDLDGDAFTEFVSLVGLPDGSEAVYFVLEINTVNPTSDSLLLPNLGSSNLLFRDVLSNGLADAFLFNTEAATLSFKENSSESFDLSGEFDTVLTDVHAKDVAVHDFTGDALPDIIVSAGDHLVTLLSEVDAPEPPPVNHLRVADVEGLAGDVGIDVPVNLSNESSVDAFTFYLGFDAVALLPTDVTLGTASLGVDPDFASVDLGIPGAVGFEVSFDVAPLDGKVLAPGNDQELFRAIFDVSMDAQPGTSTLEILDTASDKTSTLRFEGEALPFTSEAGTFTVQEPPVAPASATLNLGDAVGEQGESGIRVPVYLSTDASVEAYTVVVEFDNTALQATGVDLTESVTEGLMLLEVNGMVDANNELGYIAYTAFLMPMPGNSIGAGENLLLFHLNFDILPEAATGDSPLQVLDELEGTLIKTMITSDGMTQIPEFVDGNVLVNETSMPSTNTIFFPDLVASQGEEGIVLEVFLTNESPVDLLTVVLGFDPLAFSVSAIDTGEGTVVDSHGMFFTETVDNFAGFTVVDVLFYETIFGGESLSPGTDQTLFRLTLDVDPNAAVGDHAITLLTESPGGEFGSRLVIDENEVALETAPGTITVEPGISVENPNKLRVGDTSARAGTTGVELPVLMTNEDTVVGFTALGLYDPSVLDVVNFSFLESTTSSSAPPDFASPEIRPEDGYFSYSVILDLFPPFDGKEILPGTDTAIFHVVLDVPETTPPGDVEIQLKNGIDGTNLENILVRMDGTSVFPELRSGVLSVEEALSEPIFMRGDVNSSGRLDIADQSYIAVYLSGAGEIPSCMDAADADDSGVVDTDDLLYILYYIFEGYAAPPAPFPEMGPDPTEDDLDCAVSQG